MKKNNGQLYVASQFSKSGQAVGEEERKERMIEVDTFETTPAQVEAKLGMTVNLGNFESLRVDAGVSLPCYKEEVEKAQTLAFQLVERELFAKVREVKGSL